MANRLQDIEPSEATALFAALPFSQHAKARTLGYSMAAISRWERGDRPTEEKRKVITRKYKIPEAAWFRPMPENPPEPYGGGRAWQTSAGVRAHLASRIPGVRAPTPEHIEGALSVSASIKKALERPQDDMALRQLYTMSLHDLTSRTESAIEELSERERIVCHKGYQLARRVILETLDCDERLHRAATEALPEPDPDGPVAQLREIRAELEQLIDDTKTRAEQRMAIGNTRSATLFVAQQRSAERRLRKATLEAGNLRELFAGLVWQRIAAELCDVLRTDHEALECVREELEPLRDTEPFVRRVLEELVSVSFITWPARQFQKDIPGFARYVLGVEPWAKQLELLLMIQDNDWSACASGHRVSKSHSLAIIVLWFYCCFDNARVFMTAPTERQLDDIDWRQINMLRVESGLCVACKAENKKRKRVDWIQVPCAHSAVIPGEFKEKSKGGAKYGFCEIKGFTSKDAEGAAGIAGENVLFVVEEASGVQDTIFVALKGNLAGGGRMALFGNPTRNIGEFYAAFHKKKKAKAADGDEVGNYATMQISSWDSPNVAAGVVVIKGLATRDWCEARKAEWGEDSALYKIRVLGQFAVGEDGRIFSVALIEQCEQRWEETEEDGPLVIGLDPAGPTGSNDESTFAPRMGQRCNTIVARKGLDEDGHLAECVMLRQRYRPRELVYINIDSEGLGTGIANRLEQYALANPGQFRVRRVRASSAAVREVNIYDRMRDLLAGNLQKWMRAGGAIPEDLKLSAELHALELKMKITPNGERWKLTSKDEIKKLLKRSCDRYDALALSVWEPSNEDEDGAQREQAAITAAAADRTGSHALDPYGGDGDYSGGAIDPYGPA